MKKNNIELIDKRFGRLTIKNFYSKNKRRIILVCLCDCGNSYEAEKYNILLGNILSCGCLKKEQAAKLNFKHGQRRNSKTSITYNSWRQMIKRCTRENPYRKFSYIKEGITVCDEWKNSFQAFYEHIGERPSLKHSLDRIDGTKGYFPGNVRWATATEQANNKIKRVKIECYFDGCCEPRNPGGYAAFGSVVFIDGKRVWELSKVFVPQKGKEYETSNNLAEYSGFISILEYLIEQKLNKENIFVYGDSMLVLCQTLMDDPKWHKRWEIKKGFYVPLAYKALELLRQFPRIKGEWIPREKNTIADELSKRELKRMNVEFKIQPEN